MSPFQALLLLWAVSATITAAILGRRKRRPWTGFLLGLILGWIGVIVIAVVPARRPALQAR
jgi:predicted membrane protein